MPLRINIDKATCRDIEEVKRMYYHIEIRFGSWKQSLWKRFSAFRRLDEELKVCCPFFKNIELPKFPIMARYNGGYTNKLTQKQVRRRVIGLRKYLRRLSTNHVALSTKYFPEFLKMPTEISRRWINSSKGYIKYNEKIEMKPIKKMIYNPKKMEDEKEEEEGINYFDIDNSDYDSDFDSDMEDADVTESDEEGEMGAFGGGRIINGNIINMLSKYLSGFMETKEENKLINKKKNYFG